VVRGSMPGKTGRMNIVDLRGSFALNRHLSPFRVCDVNCLAIMAEGFFRIAAWVSRFAGAFSPGVTITNGASRLECPDPCSAV